MKHVCYLVAMFSVSCAYESVDFPEGTTAAEADGPSYCPFAPSHESAEWLTCNTDELHNGAAAFCGNEGCLAFGQWKAGCLAPEALVCDAFDGVWCCIIE